MNNESAFLPSGAIESDGVRTYETMESGNFFENILNQTGETIGNAVVGTVQAGANALNTAIANSTPAPAPAPSPSPAPSPAISAKTLGLVALGVLLAVWAVKNQKE